MPAFPSFALSRGPQLPTIPAITEKAVGELIVPRCDGAIDLGVAEHDNCHTCDEAVNPLIFRAFGWRESDFRNVAKCRDGPDSDIKTRARESDTESKASVTTVRG